MRLTIFGMVIVLLAVLFLDSSSDAESQMMRRRNFGVVTPPRSSTYFGYALGTADSGTVAGPGPKNIVAPASMSEGDLVIVVAAYRANNVTLTISETAGQTWTSEIQGRSATGTVRLFWCKFNGTWAETTSVTNTSGTAALNCAMYVFRPADGNSHTWAKDYGPDTSRFAAPGSPYNVTITGITTNTDSTVCFAVAFTEDDNSLINQSGSWTNPPPYTGQQNLAGSDIAMQCYYYILAAKGATGNQVTRENTLGGDPGCTYRIALK
jgi:hypothetical protein